jgi:hypothetical protein
MVQCWPEVGVDALIFANHYVDESVRLFVIVHSPKTSLVSSNATAVSSEDTSWRSIYRSLPFSSRWPQHSLLQKLPSQSQPKPPSQSRPKRRWVDLTRAQDLPPQPLWLLREVRRLLFPLRGHPCPQSYVSVVSLAQTLLLVSAMGILNAIWAVAVSIRRILQVLLCRFHPWLRCLLHRIFRCLLIWERVSQALHYLLRLIQTKIDISDLLVWYFIERSLQQ